MITYSLSNSHGWRDGPERLLRPDWNSLMDGDVIDGGGLSLRVSDPDAAPVCRVCAAPLTRGDPTPTAGLALCQGCMAEAGRQAQPVPGYTIVRELDGGSFGKNYLALRHADTAAVALKVLDPAHVSTSGLRERFLRQAHILAQLDHWNVAAFRDVVEAGGTLSLATEYLPGTDSLLLLKKEGPLPIGRAVGIICEALQGLAHVHARGFVHRDVKPYKLRIASEFGRERIVLTGFALARVFQAETLSGLTMTGEVGGTLAFMAPEQVTNYRDVTPAADQYAAAASLYNLLTGHYVYDPPGDVSRLFGMILNDDPVPIRSRRPDLPEGLAASIHRALARDPENRFPDVEAFRQALLPFARK